MRWRLPLAVFLLTCAVSGWVTLNAIPGFINKYAVQRLGPVSLKYLPEQVIFVTV